MDIKNSLIEQAKFFGSSTSYVQGAGGNLSVKDKNVIWIKASGTRLKDAEKNEIFIPLKLDDARSVVLESEKLDHLILNFSIMQGLRPSIETAIHTLLPHKYVTHIHSVGSIAVSTQKNSVDQFNKLTINADKFVIPYLKPGIQLARGILGVLENSPISAECDAIFLLENHGLISASNNEDSLVNNIITIEKHFTKSIEFPRLRNLEIFEKYVKVFPESTLNSNQRNYLRNGPLTPDQVVYLGAKPFQNFEDRNDNSGAFIDSDGAVWVSSDLSSDAKEVVESFVSAALVVDTNEEINYLSQTNVDEILNWDAEKWRKSQEK